MTRIPPSRPPPQPNPNASFTSGDMELGAYIQPAGDTNADGYDDLLISTRNRVWLIYGGMTQ